MMIRKRWIVLALVAALMIGLALFLVSERARAPANDAEQATRQTTEDEETFDRSRHNIDEPGSPWWIVNRERPLPSGYTPPDLTVPEVRLRLNASEEQMQISQQIVPALEEMFEAAEDDHVQLVFGSGYRSESLQRQFYESYVARDGQAAADRYSARPGTSEHQTGLAFDVTSLSGQCHLEVCFADMPEGLWLRDNAYRFGFIIRYPEGKENVTGYQYEPWHLRYVGVELANELHDTDQTMEEFFETVAFHPPALALAQLGGCGCCC